MSYFVLILSALAQVDGGTRDALTPLYANCPEVSFSDGGAAPFAVPVQRTGSFINELPFDAGATSDWYFPYPRPQRVACRLAACEARVVELDAWGRGLQLPWWAGVTIGVLAAGLGAWGAYELCVRVPVLCGGR